MEQRGDSPVLVMYDGVTKSIFANLILAQGMDFPSCEKVVNVIVQDLDNLRYRRAGASVRQRAFHSCVTQGGDVCLDRRYCARDVR